MHPASIGCGLKRGFTFYHHRLGEKNDPRTSFDDQLLVAASPHDEIGDTHWYRADFDEFLVSQAQALGVDYFDGARVERVDCAADCVRLEGARGDQRFSLSAKLIIDATGPRGLLHQTPRLEEDRLPQYPKTQALWSHFKGADSYHTTQSARRNVALPSRKRRGCTSRLRPRLDMGAPLQQWNNQRRRSR